jgi:hypothetical protein
MENIAPITLFHRPALPARRKVHHFPPLIFLKHQFKGAPGGKLGVKQILHLGRGRIRNQPQALKAVDVPGLAPAGRVFILEYNITL